MGDGFYPFEDQRKDQLHKLLSPSPISTKLFRLEKAHVRLLQRLKAVNDDLDQSRFNEKHVKKDLNIQTFFLNNILDKMEEGVLFIDKEGTILLCNNNAKKYLNKNNEKLLNRSFWDFYPDRFFGFSLRSSLFYGTVYQKSRLLISPALELEVLCQKPESPFPLEGLFIYIKACKTSSYQAYEKNKQLTELGKMTASLSHEMRNQLGGIRGFSALLMRDLEDMPHLQDMARQVLDCSKNLEYYLSSALNFSRKINLSLMETNVNQYIKELIEFFKKDPACPPNVHFESHLPYQPLITMIDPIYLRSALLNILLNGIEAMEDEGKITVSLLQQNDQLLIMITDTGRGISEDQIDKIFSPYFTTKEKGNGIGLAEVDKIIRAHGGRIEVRSQIEEGTTFSIYIPIKKDGAS